MIYQHNYVDDAVIEWIVWEERVVRMLPLVTSEYASRKRGLCRQVWKYQLCGRLHFFHCLFRDALYEEFRMIEKHVTISILVLLGVMCAEGRSWGCFHLKSAELPIHTVACVRLSDLERIVVVVCRRYTLLSSAL